MKKTLILTFTRPSTDVEFYKFSEDESKFINEKYSTLGLPNDKISKDQLTLTVSREGDEEILNNFIFDLQSQNCIMNKRIKYCENNKIIFNFKLI